MENQDFENANIQLERIRSIFNYLIATLDDSYELSRDLANMYTFFIIETIKASSSKSIKHIDDILPIVKDLRNTWAEADVLARKRN
jgi:flagellar protein FliS